MGERSRGTAELRETAGSKRTAGPKRNMELKKLARLDELTVSDLKVLFTFSIVMCSTIMLSVYFNYYLLAVLVLGVMMLIFSTSMFYGAPWFPAEKTVVKKMVDMARLKDGDVVYDLGSGDARILIEAAKEAAGRRKRLRLVGIEINPFVYAISKFMLRMNALGDKIKIRRQNFFSADIQDADVIFTFLLQKTNYRLEKKLKTELRKGTRVVSHLWKFPNLKLVKADEKLKVYLYRV